MLLGGSPTYRVKSINSKKKYLNINLIDIIDLVAESLSYTPSICFLTL